MYKSVFVKFFALAIFFEGSAIRADLPPPNEWQFIDKESGQVFPWYTKPFLDVLATWDMSDWDVFEWGSGYSTLWFATHCRSLVSIDSNIQWIEDLQLELNKSHNHNVTLKCRDGAYPFLIDGGGEDSSLVNAIDETDKLYDCIIIDCSCHRNACAVVALKHLKENGILILDNANQASIELDSTPTFELLKEYEHYSYLQPGHPDWRTDFWIIKKSN